MMRRPFLLMVSALCSFLPRVEHLYVPQDLVTCQRFDFPVVLSGHDHHLVDQVEQGTRLLKAGSDAKHAVVLDIRWADGEPGTQPTIEAQTLAVSDYAENADIAARVRRAYSVLDHLKHTQVARVPDRFRPLSSEGSRARLCSVGRFLWSALRDALCTDDVDESTVDCVLISGGDIRGGCTYADGQHLSLADLRSELQEELVAVVVQMPGHVLAAGVKESHSVGPNPGFLQMDDGVLLDSASGAVTHVGTAPLDPQRMYRVATTLWSCQNGSATSWIAYFAAHPERKPQFDAPVLATVLMHFSSQVWRAVWESLDTNRDGVLSAEEIAAADLDGDGRLSRHEVAVAMHKAGWEVDEQEMGFVDKVMEAAGDTNRDGYLDRKELESASKKMRAAE